MKKILCLTLCLVMLFGLVGCSGAKKTTVTFWAIPILEEEPLEKYVEAFEKENPDIDVVLEYITWAGIAEKLQIALSTNDLPDVYIDGAARTASLPAKGVLAPVDDLYNEIGGWYSSVEKFGVLDGTHYLLPATQIATSVITVNATLAKELGVYDLLPEDKISWNIQDFYAFCKAAAEAGADKGIKAVTLYSGSATCDDATYSLIMGNGGQIVDTENKTCVANDAKNVEVVEVLSKLVAEGYCTKGAEVLGAEGFANEFLNGKTVLDLTSKAPDVLVSYQQMVTEGYIKEEDIPTLETYGFPHADDVDPMSVCWGANGLAVFKNEDEKVLEASKAFAKYLMQSVEFSEEVWNYIPSYSPSRENGAKFTNDSAKMVEYTNTLKDFTAKYANSNCGILEAYWPEVRNNFYPNLQSAYSGAKTAQQAMDAFAEAVNKALKNY